MLGTGCFGCLWHTPALPILFSCHTSVARPPEVWDVSMLGMDCPMPSSHRLVLIVGSQCQSLPELRFLPKGAGPVNVADLPESERLLVDLCAIMVDGPGECVPVDVDGQSLPGLLLNP